MATTFAIFTALENDPPSSAYATLAIRTTGVSVLKFAQSVISGTVFKGMIPSGFGLATMNITIWWASNTATTGAVVWGAAIDNSTSHSIDTDSYGAQSTTTTTTNAVAAKPSSTVITITTGNQQSLAVEQPFKLQIQRVGTNGSDTMADTASIEMIEVSM